MVGQPGVIGLHSLFRLLKWRLGRVGWVVDRIFNGIARLYWRGAAVGVGSLWVGSSASPGGGTALSFLGGGGVSVGITGGSEAENVLTTVRHNPGGIAIGMMDTFRYFNARGITPRADDFVTLPQSPGVYIARDATGTPVYVGSSTTSLQRRVPEHFARQQSNWVSHADTIKIIQTDSGPDALALECRLIKQFQPEGNKKLRGAGPCPIYTEVPAPLALFDSGP